MSKIYSKYPSYKESGIEWIGEIPEHWDTLPIKRIVSIPVTDGPHETPELIDEGIPFVSAESIRNNKIDFDKKRGFISIEEHKRFCKKYKPQRNDIYMIKSGATTGNLAIVETDDDFNIWSPLAVIRTKTTLANYRFIFTAMNSPSFQTSIQLFWNFGTQQNIGMNVIENLAITLPPLPEQRSIAAFLDRETSYIDKLIEKKERLIELLKEKRQALITRAVTKGLDSTVNMKDSGVTWIGEIPEHWEVRCLKHITRLIIDGSHFTPTYVNDGIPFLRVTDIHERDIDWTNVKYISESEHKELSKRCDPLKGDLLLSKNGTIGVPKVVDWDGEFSIFVSLCLLKLKDMISPYYLYYFCKSSLLAQQIAYGSKQSTVLNLHLDKIKEFDSPLPPLPEQQAIVVFLDRQTSQIDMVIDKIEIQIDKLRELWQTLISNAVTGKIDVREVSA